MRVTHLGRNEEGRALADVAGVALAEAQLLGEAKVGHLGHRRAAAQRARHVVRSQRPVRLLYLQDQTRLYSNFIFQQKRFLTHRLLHGRADQHNMDSSHTTQAGVYAHAQELLAC